MLQGDIKLHVFMFFMRTCLFVVTGIVLHATHAQRSVFADCPALWESMTTILSLKCIRSTVCRVTMHHMDLRVRETDLFDICLHLGCFIIECVVTSCALNSPACVEAMSAPFGGHPMIAYVNGLSCAWDGCLTLSVALFVSIDRRARPMMPISARV